MYKYGHRAKLLTERERNFFKLLNGAAGEDYYVFPQVHLDGIVWHKIKGQNSFKAFHSINQKSVDFILCEKGDLAIKLAIELDDSTHDAVDRKERDRFVEEVLVEADLPLLRIREFKEISLSELKELIFDKID